MTQLLSSSAIAANEASETRRLEAMGFHLWSPKQVSLHMRQEEALHPYQQFRSWLYEHETLDGSLCNCFEVLCFAAMAGFMLWVTNDTLFTISWKAIAAAAVVVAAAGITGMLSGVLFEMYLDRTWRWQRYGIFLDDFSWFDRGLRCQLPAFAVDALQTIRQAYPDMRATVTTYGPDPILRIQLNPNLGNSFFPPEHTILVFNEDGIVSRPEE